MTAQTSHSYVQLRTCSLKQGFRNGRNHPKKQDVDAKETGAIPDELQASANHERLCQKRVQGSGFKSTTHCYPETLISRMPSGSVCLPRVGV